MKIKLAMFISGGGSTMEAIVRACQDGELSDLEIEPALIISSNPNSPGLEKAKNLGIAPENILIINPKDFQDRDSFGEAILKVCQEREVNLIGQFGWMTKTPDNVINAYPKMIINQHPGPLDPGGNGDFGGAGMYGLRVHQARLEFVNKTNRPARNASSIVSAGGDFWTEATTHRVTSNFDEGAVIKRKQVPIFPEDTAETLQARVLPIEHEVQIEVLRDFADNIVEEHHREAPLVLPEEKSILEECKQNAKKLYPNG